MKDLSIDLRPASGAQLRALAHARRRPLAETIAELCLLGGEASAVPLPVAGVTVMTFAEKNRIELTIGGFAFAPMSLDLAVALGQAIDEHSGEIALAPDHIVKVQRPGYGVAISVFRGAVPMFRHTFSPGNARAAAHHLIATASMEAINGVTSLDEFRAQSSMPSHDDLDKVCGEIASEDAP